MLLIIAIYLQKINKRVYNFNNSEQFKTMLSEHVYLFIITFGTNDLNIIYKEKIFILEHLQLHKNYQFFLIPSRQLSKFLNSWFSFNHFPSSTLITFEIFFLLTDDTHFKYTSNFNNKFFGTIIKKSHKKLIFEDQEQ